MPELPRKKSRPSWNVTVCPLATRRPFFARKPLMTTSEPTGKLVLRRPRLRRVIARSSFDAQLVIDPSGFFTST